MLDGFIALTGLVFAVAGVASATLDPRPRRVASAFALVTAGLVLHAAALVA